MEPNTFRASSTFETKSPSTPSSSGTHDFISRLQSQSPHLWRTVQTPKNATVKYGQPVSPSPHTLYPESTPTNSIPGNVDLSKRFQHLRMTEKLCGTVTLTGVAERRSWQSLFCKTINECSTYQQAHQKTLVTKSSEPKETLTLFSSISREAPTGK